MKKKAVSRALTKKAPPTPAAFTTAQELVGFVDTRSNGWIELDHYLAQRLAQSWKENRSGNHEIARRYLTMLLGYHQELELLSKLPPDVSFVDFMCALAAIAQMVDQMNPVLKLFKRELEGSELAWGLAASLELTRWKNVLKSLELEVPHRTKTLSEARTLDLRLLLEAGSARIEYQDNTKKAAAWKQLSSAMFRKLSRGDSSVLAAAVPLWRAVSRCFQNYYDEISLHDADFWSMLLAPPLEETVLARLVNGDGQQLQISEEVLHWSVREPQADVDDYQLGLALPDGTMAAVECGVASRPALYLVGHQLHPGPPLIPAHLMRSIVGYQMSIPAPAMESVEGVQALMKLDVPLPGHVRKQTKICQVRCRVEASIVGPAPGEQVEINVDLFDDAGEEAGYLFHNGAVAARRILKEGQVYDHRDARIIGEALIASGAVGDWSSEGRFIMKMSKKLPAQLSEFLLALPPETELILSPELAGLDKPPVSASIQLEVEETGIDWFDVTLAVKTEDVTLTKEEKNALLKADGGWVRLGAKGWRRLAMEMVPEQEEQLARLGLSSRQMGDGEKQRFHALQLAENAARRFLPAEQADAIRRRAADIQARVTPPVPAAVTATLRPYQEDGYHFLCYLSANNFGGILADDMGLGKTLQTLSWIEHLRKQEKPVRGRKLPPVLVVCPKSVMDNWHAEAARFLPHLRVKILRAGDLSILGDDPDSADVFVINYAGLRALDDKAARQQYLAVILDEAQAIKNPTSESTRAACALKARHRLALTGTPVENRLLDLWSIMAFAMPGVLGNRASFGRLYDGKDDPLARRRLAARVRPFLIRRTKGQVAQDLPDRIEEDLLCVMDGYQATLYKAELKNARQILLKLKSQQELNKERFNILTSLLRLRQICCDPRLLSTTAKPGDSAKLEALQDTVGPLLEEGNKVLIFSQFVSMLDLLRTAMESNGVPIFYLAGDTENRGELVSKFQAAEGAAVFLISLKAGGFGLNLTAASHVVLFDPWWNPAVEAQAIDRTHRIGQTQKVIAWRILIKDTIEEKIRLLQKQKASLAGDLLGEEKFSESLTMDDLHYLFAE